MTKISNKEELRQLIIRYLRGQATHEEIVFLKKYYDHFDEKYDGLEELDADERAHLKMEIYSAIDGHIESPKTSRNSFWGIRRIAAVLIFLVVTAAAFWIPTYYLKSDTDVEHLPANVTHPVQMTFEATDKILHHYLPDGSYVALEPGSEITYQTGFMDELREVQLIGEAFFDVSHDKDRPFVVLANGVATTVLGTAFRITSTKHDREFSISVTRGRVQVSDQFQQFGVLEKNDQLVLDLESHQVVKTKLKQEETDNVEPEEFIMDGITVGKAVDIVSKRWDCEFVVPNPDLYECQFTTSFLPTDQLRDVVAVIAAVIGAEFQIDGKVVTLTGKGCIE